MKRTFIVFGFLVAIMQAAPALACDLCALYRSMEAKTSKTGPNLGVFEQFTNFGTMQDNGTRVPNPAGQNLDSSITQFLVGYQFTDRFGLQLDLPYIHRSFKRPTYPGDTLVIDSGTVDGLGDVSLIGHYRAFRHMSEETLFVWDLLGGVKFPTGDSSRLKEELDEMMTPDGMPASGVHGHDLALGSGSYDGIVGTALFARWQRLFVNAGMQYAVRTRGTVDYRYANDLTWNVKPGAFVWLSRDRSLGVQLVLAGEDKGRDNLKGMTADDTGITTFSIGPELSFTWQDNLSAELGAEFPVVNDNTALQLVPDYRVRAAVTWRF